MTPKQFELLHHVLDAIENPEVSQYNKLQIEEVLPLLGKKIAAALLLDPDYLRWLKDNIK